MRTLAAALLALLAAAALADGKIRVELNGKPLQLKVAPIVKGSDVWVPVQETTNALGGHLQVIRPGKLLGVCLGKKCVPFKIGPRGDALMIKRTAVAPAQKMAEALDARAQWDRRNGVLRFSVSRRLPPKKS